VSVLCPLLPDIMTHRNPYVQNLIDMGYDQSDCETVADVGITKSFPYTVYGRTYNTQEEYDEALHDFLNSL